METGTKRLDPAHKYATKSTDVVGRFICNFCGKVTNGGVYRAKQHVVGGYRDAKECPRCPEHVRQEIKDYMANKKMVKEGSNLLPDFDDIGVGEDEEDAEEAEEREIVGSKSSRPKSSKTRTSNSTSSVRKKSKGSGGIHDYYSPVAPEVVVRERKNGKGVEQTSIPNAHKKELRENACQHIARWMYEAGIPFNAVNFESFQVMIESIGQCGRGMKPPSYHEVRVPLLKKEVAHTNDIMKQHKDEWPKYGCSIMTDGWKGITERTLLNFLVNSPRGTMFIESVDASAYSKTGEKLFELLDTWVEKIGESNVVDREDGWRDG